MSYTKQTWTTGDIITAEKLNHMEDGIAGAEGGGETLSNPHVNITFVKNFDDEGNPLVILGVCFIENGILKGDVELNDDSVIIDSIAQYYEFDDSYKVVLIGDITYFSVSASNTVNCTWNHGGIIVSDATQNASITITISQPNDDN